MPHVSHVRAVSTAAILAALTIPNTAAAQVPPGTPTASGILAVPTAPVTVVACRVRKGAGWLNSWDTDVTVGNRTKHQLVSAALRFVAFDSENAKIAQATVPLRMNDMVASRDTGVYPAEILLNLNGKDPKVVASVACQIVSASFTGNKKWNAGQRWTEPLLSLAPTTVTRSTTGGEGGSAGSPPRSAAVAPRVQIAVTNAWTDTLNGVTYVHDALSITGGDAPTSLRPSDLILTLTLANGARKTYAGLEQPAPTYAKINPLGSAPTTAYEVDPAADMGRIGALTILPHGTVTTTVTFAIPDPLAAGANYREVAVTR